MNFNTSDQTFLVANDLYEQACETKLTAKTEADLTKAFTEFQQAYDTNGSHYDALINLALCYNKGEGVKQDLSKSAILFTNAASLRSYDSYMSVRLSDAFRTKNGIY